jgi:hypothetical protein
MADNRNQKQCAEVGCEEPAKIRGFCSLHCSRYICVVDRCPNRVWLTGTGRCKRCFKSLDPWMYQQLKDVRARDRQQKFERLSQPFERPKWVYEGDEKALAEQYGRNDELEAAPPVLISQEKDNATGTK